MVPLLYYMSLIFRCEERVIEFILNCWKSIIFWLIYLKAENAGKKWGRSCPLCHVLLSVFFFRHVFILYHFLFVLPIFLLFHLSSWQLGPRLEKKTWLFFLFEHKATAPPPISGQMQPPRMFGMPPPPPNQSMTTISAAIGQTGSPAATQSKIDPNQIPRPVPNSSVILFDTRQGNQANLPPVLSGYT